MGVLSGSGRCPGPLRSGAGRWPVQAFWRKPKPWRKVEFTSAAQAERVPSAPRDGKQRAESHVHHHGVGIRIQVGVLSGSGRCPGPRGAGRADGPYKRFGGSQNLGARWNLLPPRKLRKGVPSRAAGWEATCRIPRTSPRCGDTDTSGGSERLRALSGAPRSGAGRWPVQAFWRKPKPWRKVEFTSAAQAEERGPIPRRGMGSNVQNPTYITTVWGYGYKWGF